MKDGCLKPEEIAAALAAGEDDPQRRHLEQCPWCQALGASLDLFRRGGGLPAGADLGDAEDRLGEFLEREIVEEEEPGKVVALPNERIGRGRRTGPVLWATAAVLISAAPTTEKTAPPVSRVIAARSSSLGAMILSQRFPEACSMAWRSPPCRRTTRLAWSPSRSRQVL